MCRSFHYHSNYEFWEQLSPDLIREAVYVGFKIEHEHFERVFKHGIRYLETSTIMDVANVIAGAEHFFANQSLLSALGQSMHVPMTMEVYRNSKTEIIQRSNVRYV